MFFCFNDHPDTIIAPCCLILKYFIKNIMENIFAGNKYKLNF